LQLRLRTGIKAHSRLRVYPGAGAAEHTAGKISPDTVDFPAAFGYSFFMQSNPVRSRDNDNKARKKEETCCDIDAQNIPHRLPAAVSGGLR
jgi:hypothetical protein